MGPCGRVEMPGLDGALLGGPGPGIFGVLSRAAIVRIAVRALARLLLAKCP